ncbi:hypothetical protein V3664_29345 [Streptomyces sp. CS62]
MPLDEVADHRSGEGAARAGHQDGALREGGRRGRGRCGRYADQPGPQHLAVAQAQVRFVGAERAEQRRRVLGVHEAEAARVFGLGGAHQPPGRGRGGAWGRGGEDQPRRREPAPVEPLAEPVQHLGGEGAGGTGGVGGAGRCGRDRQDHHRRHVRQGVQVGGAYHLRPGGLQGGADALGVRADDRAAGAGRRLGGFHGQPLHVVERLVGGAGPAQHHRVDGGHGCARLVREEEADRVGPVVDQPYPGGGRRRGVDAYAGPGERQVGAVPVEGRGEGHGVQGGVEEDGVQGVRPGCPAGGRAGYGDVREDGVGGAPGAVQAAEGGPVPRERPVEAGDVDLLGVRGYGRGRRGLLGRGGEDTGDVARPAAFPGAGVDGEGARAVGPGEVRDEPQVGFGGRQRCVGDEFGDPRAVQPGSCPQGQVDEVRPRDQDGAVHGVVGQPGLPRRGDPLAEDVPVRQFDLLGRVRRGRGRGPGGGDASGGRGRRGSRAARAAGAGRVRAG